MILFVQPFPLQTSSFFGGSTVPQSNPPAGPGNAPRHINIHIHAGEDKISFTHTVDLLT